MNIFYLDSNPYTAAQWHADKHVSKMLIETAQMLSTAHHIDGNSEIQGLYKPTHINHPCALWVRENTANYDWAWGLLNALCLEFRIRRGKQHLTQKRLLMTLNAIPDLPYAPEHTPPPLVMPDALKCDDPVQAYRAYYRQKHADGIVSYDWLREREPFWLKRNL